MPICTKCFEPMREGRISLDASGPGFTLSITAVPAYSCDHCLTALRIDESGGFGIKEIVVAVMSALEAIGPVGRGEPKDLTMHCRECNVRLPDAVDERRAHFMVNAPLGRSGKLMGVEYYGNATTCPACFVKHPHLPSTLYHAVRDSVAEAASLYIRY